MSKQVSTLLVLTVFAFLFVEGIRLATGQGWSWIWAVGFACAVIAQVFALIHEHRSD
jgi:hypothetical protein